MGNVDMQKHVLLPFSTGVEELELITIVDVLRRAEVQVCMVSLEDMWVVGRSNIRLQADVCWADKQQRIWDMIVLPGGLPNAHILCEHDLLRDLVLEQAQQQRHIAAICAAPIALATWGITQGKRVTAYPACAEEMLQLQPSSTYVAENVVQDGRLTTSQGAGTALEFSLALLTILCGQTVSDSVRQSIVA
ncbi:MAG: DJ-1/PfpI family protein [Mariprofundaceae bacterium]|nr:DJ-1/PfpI family protein [Mariprofundaceae bacterium]